MKVERLVVGPLGTNCYIVWAAAPEPRALAAVAAQNPEPCLVIDAGFEPDRILSRIAKHGLRPQLIVATHCHYDHVGAVADLLAAFPDAVFAVGAEEFTWPQSPAHNLSYGFGLPMRAPAPTRELHDNDEILITAETQRRRDGRPGDSNERTSSASPRLCGEKSVLSFKVLAVPGHSPGSMALYCASGGAVFTGDTLLANDICRGDLPGGSERQLVEAIRAKILTLPEDTVVWPGHGNRTRVGTEKKNNPYVGDGAQ